MKASRTTPLIVRTAGAASSERVAGSPSAATTECKADVAISAAICRLHSKLRCSTCLEPPQTKSARTFSRKAQTRLIKPFIQTFVSKSSRVAGSSVACHQYSITNCCDVASHEERVREGPAKSAKYFFKKCACQAARDVLL